MERVIIFVTCIQEILCHRICKLRKIRRDESARPDVFLNKLRFKSIFFYLDFLEGNYLVPHPYLLTRCLKLGPSQTACWETVAVFNTPHRYANQCFRSWNTGADPMGLGSKAANGAGAGTFVLTLWEMDVDETQIVRPAQQAQAASDDRWCRLPAMFTP